MGLVQFSIEDSSLDIEPADALARFVGSYSIEVTPRTAARIGDFSALLPIDTRVYIAHIDGTPLEDMIATAIRLVREGFAVMPHFPARLIRDRVMLEDWIRRYSDAGATQALLLAGGIAQPRGTLSSSIEMMETGLFDKYGFTRLHVAGHPEGNKDIDPDGSDARLDEALAWKQAFSERTDAEMAIVTQFVFDASPVIAWSERLRKSGVSLPIHIGIAGPAKLQTLIKYALACGVGPSIRVLQRRAMDLRKLVLPYEPSEVLGQLAAYCAANPNSLIEQVHFFPLGGILSAAEWATRASRPAELAMVG